MFDVDSFLATPVTGSNDTKYVPVPELEDALAVSSDVKARHLEARDGKPEAIIVDVVWDIDDDRVKAVTMRDKNQVRQSIFLDLTPSGAIDMGKGKNIGLGKLREALGCNDPYAPFSFQMLVGRPARVQIKQSPNEKDPSSPYSNVVAVRAI